MAEQSGRRRGDAFRAGDVVLLVPGIFGFASFGDGIQYFAGAEKVLRGAAWGGAEPPRTQVTEPPPTGSLARRVRSLHDSVASAPLAQGALVHLIGHSTGGLDARLLVNRKFLLHGLDEAARARVWDRLGRIVTLSAPLHGTPVAAQLDDDFHFGVFLLVWVAAILDKAGKLRDRKALKLLWDALRSARGATRRGGEPHLGLVNERLIPALAALLGDSTAAARVVEFFRNIQGDSSLIYDLTPRLMEELNAQITDGEILPLTHFLTVAPPPPPRLPLGGELFVRWAYRHFYEATTAGSFTHAVPDVPLRSIGVDEPGWRTAAHRPSDAVVPVASQALTWTGATLVFGDHLDVTGHYPSVETIALFKSGAEFGPDQFAALWGAIADVIRGATAIA
jgi:triacylglycerol lipase